MNLDIFFNPESIAIIGVSLSKMNRGQMILLNNERLGYNGKIYGIGSRKGEIKGIKIYDSIEKLPETPDVAIVVIPAKSIPQCLRDCGEKGIKHIVIESAGFSEYSDAKHRLESEVLAIADEYGITIMGPNCIGTINTGIRLAMPFGLFGLPEEPSGISVISQSGGIISSYMRILYNNNISYRKIVSIGNKLRLDEVDFLDYYLNDKETDQVLLYIESIKRGREFFNLCMNAEKPVIAHKSNRSEKTAMFAKSHTTALSADDDVVDAAFRQSAVIRIEDEDGLLLAAKALKMPLMKGNNIAIMSRSGGHGVITVDACAKYGFDIAGFPDDFIDRANGLFNFSVINVQNPLDLGEILDYTIFAEILEEILKLENVDGVITFLNYQPDYEGEMARTFLKRTGELVLKYGKPVATSLVSSPEELLDIAMSQPLPIFPTTLQAAQALFISKDYHERKIKRNSRGSVKDYNLNYDSLNELRSRCTVEKRIPLTDEALRICSSMGLGVIPGIRIADENDIETIDIGFPVALKLLSGQASHKSDVGGVILNIKSGSELSTAIMQIKNSLYRIKPDAAIDGFLVQKMSEPGEEFFIGGRQDPTFGPIVIAGFGGIFLEVIKDRSIRVAPVTKNEAIDMLEELKMFPVLKGTRGKPPLDIEAITDAICRISVLLSECTYIEEIDINPIMVHQEGRGISIVDARMFFE